jgi:hypothetical protein
MRNRAITTSTSIALCGDMRAAQSAYLQEGAHGGNAVSPVKASEATPLVAGTARSMGVETDL